MGRLTVPQTFTIPGTLPGMNDYTEACRANYRAGAAMKSKAEERIIWAIKSARLKPVRGYPVTLHYTWYEKNQKRDKDNISMAQKFVQDALVKARIMPNDGWKEVEGFTHSFKVDKKNPRIEVTICEVN